MTSTDIRKALDEVLREAAASLEVKADSNEKQEDRWWRHDHPWRQPDNGDSDGSTDCAAHKEIQNCCLDPNHGAYNKLLDYLAERIASKLMYRGGVVTNVVASRCTAREVGGVKQATDLRGGFIGGDGKVDKSGRVL